MRSILAAIALAFAIISTPTFADEPYAVTPSGATEAYFEKSVVETSDYLANKCVDLGWTMISSTATTVVCEVPVSFGQRLLSALAAPRYSTPPRQFFRFNLAGVNGNTRVQASSWQETQTAFGQTQRTEMESSNYHNTVMQFFITIGGFYPPGTTFPNHVLAGFSSDAVESPEKGLQIREVAPGSPFDRAGLKVGDVVTRIAGERTKDGGDLLDGLHKAVKAPTYEVQYVRGGDKMKAIVDREFRPAYTERLPEHVAEAPEPTTVIQQAPALSVADELAKFAKLRDDGVLTEAEFQAEKARLLAPATQDVP